MSGALAALGTLGTIGSQALNPILGAFPAGTIPAWIRNVRKIGAIVPDCVIEEQHNDKVQLTMHAVADNAPISDHAFIQPASLTMRIGWTNANLFGSITEGAISGFAEGGIGGALSGGFQGGLSTFKEERVKEVYAKMLALQSSLKLFEIVTGKRNYKNMMLVDMGVKTDHTSEYALMMECHFQEVRLAHTGSTTQPKMSEQKMPDKTAKTADSSEPHAKPVRSIYSTGSGIQRQDGPPAGGHH